MGTMLRANNGLMFVVTGSDPTVRAATVARLRALPEATLDTIHLATGAVIIIDDPAAVVDGRPNPAFFPGMEGTIGAAFEAAWAEATSAGLKGCEIVPVTQFKTSWMVFVVHGEGPRAYAEIAPICREAVIGGFETFPAP